MEKKLYRIWYALYLLDGEEDFAECEAESIEDARHWFKSHFDNHITYVEEVSCHLL